MLIAAEDKALFDSILLLNKSCIGVMINQQNKLIYENEVKHLIHLYNIHNGTTYNAEKILSNIEWKR